MTFEPPWDLRKAYVENPSGNDPVVISCPFHEDSTASFAIYSDHGYCFGCRKWESWKDHARRRAIEADPKEPLYSHEVEVGSRGSGGGSSKEREVPTPEKLRELSQYYAQLLWENNKKLSYLRGRGLEDATIRYGHLGYTGRAYVIPIIDKDVECIRTLRFRRDDESTQNQFGDATETPRVLPKYWGIPGLNEGYLYSPKGVGKHTVLCEGELDCLIATQCGYHAITVTNGIGSIRLDLLGDRVSEIEQLTIATDQDGPGWSGALQLKRDWKEVIPKIRIVKFYEKDLNDLYLKKGISGVQAHLGPIL